MINSSTIEIGLFEKREKNHITFSSDLTGERAAYSRLELSLSLSGHTFILRCVEICDRSIYIVISTILYFFVNYSLVYINLIISIKTMIRLKPLVALMILTIINSGKCK